MSTLPRNLRQTINKLSHNVGEQHAEATKRCLLDEATAMQAAGASAAQILEHLLLSAASHDQPEP